MKFALAAILCFLTSAAVAQVIGDGMGSPYGGSKAAVTYTGPGDVVSGATAWYGLRAYSSAQIGGAQKAVNLRRASDNTTCDFDINTSGNLGGTDSGCGTGVGLSLAAFATQDATCTGTIASTTLTCASASSTPHAGSTLTGTGIVQPSYIVSCGTFTAGAGTCTLNAAQTVSVSETITMIYGLYFTELYDQSGNTNHVTQATAGSQPQLLPLCINSLPCMLLNGATPLAILNSSAFTTVASPQSASFVWQRFNAAATARTIMTTASGNLLLGNGSTNQVEASQASSLFTATASDNVWHATEVIANGASSGIDVDGTFTPGTTTARASGTTLSIGATGSGSASTTYSTEWSMWPIAFNSTQYGGLCHNQFLYWGTPNSC